MTGPTNPKTNPSTPGNASGTLAPSTTVKTVINQVPLKSTPSQAIFTVLKGPHVGKVLSLPVGQLITLGRSEECTYRFEDGGLSRIHARVICIAGQYALTDAGSTNGTFLNDQRITSTCSLQGGDRIQLGTELTLGFMLISDAEESALRKVYEAAMRDGLTGVYNRKHLEERLDSEITFALRHNSKLSLILQDIDLFKKVNDTYGHLAGDAVLREIGRILQQNIRTEDLVARYGGEEFVLLLRGIDLPAARQMANRLRNTIADTTIYYDGIQLRITSSAGVASLDECSPQSTKEALLALADSRLYQAKQSGRNRVI